MPSLKAKVQTATERFAHWAAKKPCPPNEPGAPTINLWIKGAARVCQLKGIKPEVAVQLIRDAMTRPEKFPREVERTVERTYAQDLDSMPTVPTAPLAFQPCELDFIAWTVTEDIDDAWLRQRSPRPT